VIGVQIPIGRNGKMKGLELETGIEKMDALIRTLRGLSPDRPEVLASGRAQGQWLTRPMANT
jgi:hypothetical protein